MILNVIALKENNNKVKDDWHIPFIKIKNGEVLEDQTERILLLQHVASYQLINGKLF